MQMRLGKPENGNCYYSEKALLDSAAVREMKLLCTMQELYNRLLLLTSPSDAYYLPERATASVVDDVIISAHEPVTDGFGEMSLNFALRFGLVKQEQVEECSYHAIQFRGLLADAATGDVILAKAKLAVRKRSIVCCAEGCRARSLFHELSLTRCAGLQGWRGLLPE